MPAKQLVFHDTARGPIRRGVDALADAVHSKQPSGDASLASGGEMPML
ncbi:MAG: hypothetical protein WA174_14090 [Rhodoferax sp.]